MYKIPKHTRLGNWNEQMFGIFGQKNLLKQYFRYFTIHQINSLTNAELNLKDCQEMSGL